MKKLFLFMSICVVLAIVFSLNFSGLNHSKEYFDLRSVIELPTAEAVDHPGKKCDYKAPDTFGIPFWDRTCDDCAIHFNNWYGNGGTCIPN